MIHFYRSGFITGSEYLEKLFTISDGGSIEITHPNGESYMGVCFRTGKEHFTLNGDCYCTLGFARMLRRRRAYVRPIKEPEMVGSYRIIERIPIGDKLFIMGHDPYYARHPYVTWQAYRDHPGKDCGCYWSNHFDAGVDLRRRAEAERTGIPYDHTNPKLFKTVAV